MIVQKWKQYCIVFTDGTIYNARRDQNHWHPPYRSHYLADLVIWHIFLKTIQIQMGAPWRFLNFLPWAEKFRLEVGGSHPSYGQKIIKNFFPIFHFFWVRMTDKMFVSCRKNIFLSYFNFLGQENFFLF